MTLPRTDLALEAADDLAARAKKFSLPEGIRRLESLQEGYPVTDIRVTGDGARTLGKPAGRYITVDLTPCFQRQQAFFHRAVWCIAYQLRALLPHVGCRSQILVVGLGNRAMTPDAIGPIAVENLLVTRHMVRALPRQFQGFTPVSALCTGVLARTGLETLELIQGAAAHIRPAAVIAIDALAARSRQRLCATVQLSDTGLIPGSGVGNHRRAVDRAALGVPVIAVGVPTVIDGATLCADLLEEAGREGRLNFIGNVEANTALLGGADVIVADGYSGNILLKTVEGTAKLLLGEMKKAFLSSTKGKLGALLVKDSLRNVKKLLDPSEVGGTPFLGISKPVLKAHGSSDARAIRNAVFRAVEYAQSGIIADVEAHIDVMKVEKNG